MNLGTLTFIGGTFALVAYVTASAYAGANLMRRAALRENPLLHPVEAAARLVFIALCGFLGWASGLPPFRLGWRWNGLGEEVLWGLAAGAMLAVINRWTTRWAVERYGPAVYQPAFLRAIMPRGPGEWRRVALALLPAALAEEMLFRGLAIGGLSVFAPPLLLALVFAGLFGLAHLPQGRLGVVGAGALGFVLGVLFLWRWSVVACTVAHYVVNLAQLAQGEAELRWLEGVEKRRSPK